MGKTSNVLNRYFRNKERFADLFNGFYFKGESVIRAEMLTEASEVYVESGGNNSHPSDKIKTTERVRDIKMRLVTGELLRVLAVENQNHVDYTMPFRCMQYDTMEYGQQIDEIKHKNDSLGKYASWAERFCKFHKGDRLIPVYTLCIYHGEEKWDGPRSLKDMMDFGNDADSMSQFFADYPFRLICLNEECDFSLFHTENRQLFQAMKYRKDKKKLREVVANHTEFEHINADTLEAISAMLNEPQLWNNRNKYLKREESKEKYDMCQAMREWAAEEQSIGMEKGENLMASLIRLLLTDNRIEDIKLAAENKEIRNSLYQEYSLV